MRLLCGHFLAMLPWARLANYLSRFRVCGKWQRCSVLGEVKARNGRNGWESLQLDPSSLSQVRFGEVLCGGAITSQAGSVGPWGFPGLPEAASSRERKPPSPSAQKSRVRPTLAFLPKDLELQPSPTPPFLGLYFLPL